MAKNQSGRYGTSRQYSNYSSNAALKSSKGGGCGLLVIVVVLVTLAIVGVGTAHAEADGATYHFITFGHIDNIVSLPSVVHVTTDTSGYVTFQVFNTDQVMNVEIGGKIYSVYTSHTVTVYLSSTSTANLSSNGAIAAKAVLEPTGNAANLSYHVYSPLTSR